MNCLHAYLDVIFCDKDGVVDWCIVLLEMPLTRFEECWPPPTKSFAELPQNINIVTLTLTLGPINSDLLTSLLLPHFSSSLTDTLPSLNLLCPSKTHARWSKSSLKHPIRFCSILSKFKTEFYCISSFKCVRLHFWTSPAVTIMFL